MYKVLDFSGPSFLICKENVLYWKIPEVSYYTAVRLALVFYIMVRKLIPHQLVFDLHFTWIQVMQRHFPMVLPVLLV